MAKVYTNFDYFIDVLNGDMPGPIGMRKVPKDDIGGEGEYYTRYILDEWPLTTGYPMYSNLIVPNPGSRIATTEIDLLMVTQWGIYVFESKNYSGYIFGDTDQTQWTVSYSKQRKERFPNPIRQNRTHIKALAAYLDLPEENFFSYIVFSRRCDLKKVPESTDEYTVCQRPQMKKHIKRDKKKYKNLYSWEIIGQLKTKLDALSTASTVEAREEHVEQIKTVQTTCPYCGKQLVERHRKKDGGMFIGCSGYPQCRYTRNQW